MKRFEYKLLYARVTIAMGGKEFSEWVFTKLNEWGAEGWFITNFQTPSTDQRGGLTLTGELLATGCREVMDVAAPADAKPMLSAVADNDTPKGPGVIGG